MRWIMTRGGLRSRAINGEKVEVIHLGSTRDNFFVSQALKDQRQELSFKMDSFGYLNARFDTGLILFLKSIYCVGAKDF